MLVCTLVSTKVEESELKSRNFVGRAGILGYDLHFGETSPMLWYSDLLRPPVVARGSISKEEGWKSWLSCLPCGELDQ